MSNFPTIPTVPHTFETGEPVLQKVCSLINPTKLLIHTFLETPMVTTRFITQYDGTQDMETHEYSKIDRLDVDFQIRFRVRDSKGEVHSWTLSDYPSNSEEFIFSRLSAGKFSLELLQGLEFVERDDETPGPSVV